MLLPKKMIFHQYKDFGAIIAEFNRVLYKMEQDILVYFEVSAETILTLKRVVNYLQF